MYREVKVQNQTKLIWKIVTWIDKSEDKRRNIERIIIIIIIIQYTEYFSREYKEI